MNYRLSKKEAAYWSGVCVVCGQVFIGIGGATLFTSPLDVGKIFVILFNIGLGILFFLIGKKLL